MGVKEDVQEAFQGLGIPDFPSDWIDSLWECDFCTESVTLPYQAVSEETLLSEECWDAAVKACKKWFKVSSSEKETAGFWTSLMEIDVSARAVLALLYALMERPKPRPVDRICAVQAARLYLLLLQVPGSGGFKLFHTMIFQKAVDAFVLFPSRGELGKGTRKEKSSKKKPKQGRRGRKRKKKTVAEGDWDSEEEEYQMEMVGGQEESATVVMEEGREEEVAGLLKLFMKEAYGFLLAYSLDLHEVSRYQLVQAFLNMARMELKPNLGLILGEGGTGGVGGASKPMCLQAWMCLDALCRPLHGSVEKLANEIFRQVLPMLLMFAENGGVSTTTPLPSHLVACSRHCQVFVEHVCSKENRREVAGPLLKLVQHVCTKVPDKAEYRNKVSPVVCSLLRQLPREMFSDFMEWLHKFSRNSKIAFRVFSLDLFSELLSVSTRTSDEMAALIDERFLLKIIISRCSDRSPSVRGRALIVLATVAGSSSSSLLSSVHAAVFSSATLNAPGTGNDGSVVDMIRRRTSDTKVGVRKAGLQVLEALVLMDTSSTRISDVQVIHERCLDPSLAVRKQSMASLTNLLLEKRDNKEMRSLWLDGVLPMVMDKEVGGEEKAVQTLEDVLLSNISTYSSSLDSDELLAWQLLSLVADDDRADLQRYLRRAVGEWSRLGKLTRPLVNAVCSHGEHEEHLKAAWMLLSEISQFAKWVDTKFIYDSWKKYCSCEDDVCSPNVDDELSPNHSPCSSSPLVAIMEVVGNLAGHMSKVAVDDIKSGILELLQSFKMPPVTIKAAINSVCLICAALTTKSSYQKTVDEWGVPLLKMCEDYIATLVKEGAGEGEGLDRERQEQATLTYIFTLGEVAQLCPVHVSRHLCLMVQSLLLASSEAPPSTGCDKPRETTPSTSQDVPPSGSSSQSALSSQAPSQPSSQASFSLLSGLSKLSMSPKLRAHTYITLGKLCLQNENLTKRSIIQMVQELRSSSHAPIRNNIVVVLCDLAVRYSSRVDPYLPVISSALRDPSLLVRRQTLTLLARLLQEDYIKWKGPLFFHFVSTLVDSAMGGFAEFCLLHLLQVKHPAMFYQHFVECVFFFNSCRQHKVYNKFKVPEGDEELFSLKGKRDLEKRMKIYRFLLTHLTDEQRFQLTGKLCQEVLGGLVDGAISLDDDGVGVVRDTLAILACKEIKLASLRSNVEEELADEGDRMGAAVAKAQTKIISQLVKRNMIENVVPIVIAAKHQFEQEHHPLLKDLLACLKELMQDYRSEVGEVLAGDPQLAEEITFDLKRFDEEQKKAAAQATPTLAMPQSLMASPLSPNTTLVPVSMATILATPPKMRTPRTLQAPLATAHRTNMHRTPIVLPLGVSPLVTVQRMSRLPTAERPRLPTAERPRLPVLPEEAGHRTEYTPYRTPAARKVGVTPGPPMALPPSSASPLLRPDEGVACQETDVSSPEAAHARCQAVRLDYGGVRNPATLGLREKVMRLPLQRGGLFSKEGDQNGRPLPRAAKATPMARPDETLADGRLASTPEGYAESVSFNVSSVLPLSPIAPSNKLGMRPTKGVKNSRGVKATPAEVVSPASLGNKGRRRSKRLKMLGEEERAKKQADIVMPSPHGKSKEVAAGEKWNVRVRSSRK